MTKFKNIFWREYSRHVFRKRFLLALFSVPLMLGFIAILVIVIIRIESSATPIGYVDQSGLLANPIPQPPVKFPEQTVPMLPFSSEADARASLDAGKIQAFYVIPQDYLVTGQLREVYNEEPKGISTQQFGEFLTTNLLTGQPAEVANRIQAGTKFTVFSADKSRQTSVDQIVNTILPFVAGILFIVAMMTSSGYLLQAVVEEKENRTMEIMVTSVSPNQMMSAKILADILIGVTQLVVWAIFIVLILFIGRSYLSFLSGITFPIKTVLLLVAVMVPAFILISGLMAAVGATVTEAGEGQQIMGLFTFPIWLPYILVAVFIQNPNSPLAIAMTLFPLTAPMTIAMRIGFTTLPTWQYVVSLFLLVLSAIGAIWLAGRAFRLGMLRYGQRLRWKEIFSLQRA